MWSLAAAVGSVTLGLLTDTSAITLEALGYVMVALTAVAVVNNIAFTLVLVLSSGQSLGSVLRGLAPVILPGWVAGWGVNLLMGLLFVTAFAGHPAAALLFPVPLVVLHLAYRGYVAARVDRLRLTGLREAAHVLSEPLHPRDAIGDYLREVVTSFECRAAALVVRTESGEHEPTCWSPARGRHSRSPPHTCCPVGATQLERELAEAQVAVRVTATDGTANERSAGGGRLAGPALRPPGW